VQLLRVLLKVANYNSGRLPLGDTFRTTKSRPLGQLFVEIQERGNHAAAVTVPHIDGTT
jgi:hypothetical protein